MSRQEILALCVGLIVLIIGTVALFTLKPTLIGALILLTGALLSLGYQSIAVRLPGGAVLKALRSPEEPTIETRTLDPDDKAKKAEYVSGRAVPGGDGSEFSALACIRPMQILPTSDPLVPMYRLDAKFRVIDWNDAFSLAFDRTMEGRRGQSVLDWVYFLDNYKDVVDHGLGRFSGDDPNGWPLIDVEELRYTSNRYGPIRPTKRAYRITDDDGSYLGWLAILQLSFEDPSKEFIYYEDLMLILNLNQMWSEYAISYDPVLTNTKVYPELLKLILGDPSDGAPLRPIPHGSRILDLGAGTGNITAKLASAKKDYVVFALEKNATMLNILRVKCKDYLREDDDAPGVIAVQQDVTSLFGLQDSSFDFVISNNVLYALQPEGVPDCLREVHRVLKPGGEVRITGPKTDTKLGPLFKTIKKELQQNGRFEELAHHYERVKRINKERLEPMLCRYSVRGVQEYLKQAGFADFGWHTEKAYAGQAMLVSARKGG